MCKPRHLCSQSHMSHISKYSSSKNRKIRERVDSSVRYRWKVRVMGSCLGVKFKISDEHPRLFHMGVPPPPRGVLTIKIFREIMFDFKRIIHQAKPITYFFSEVRDISRAGWKCQIWKGRRNILSHFLRVNVTRCKFSLSQRN